MKIQEYETCPSDSNNFVSGIGLTFKKGWKKQRIEVNVVNSYNVNVGCGADSVAHCLGAGSLELVIDGVKHIVGGDYTFKDGTGRIVVFNTFHQCKSFLLVQESIVFIVLDFNACRHYSNSNCCPTRYSTIINTTRL